MSIKESEIKLTIASLLELSYSKNKGLTKAIILKSKRASLTVDEKGNATLSSSVGVLIFDGRSAIEALGVSVKRVSVTFENEDDMLLAYNASVQMMYFGISVKGDFDFDELITSCSGLLCKAARAFKGRANLLREQELRLIMGAQK